MTSFDAYQLLHQLVQFCCWFGARLVAVWCSTGGAK